MVRRSSSFVRDFGYVILSNGVVALVTALSVLVFPRLMGVEEYGYWQFFLFLSSYSLLTQFGAGDGAYLRYGGRNLDDLQAFGIRSQVLTLAAWQTFIGVLIATSASVIVVDAERLSVLRLIAIYSLVVNIRHFFLTMLQAVGEFRAFSRITLLDRTLFVAMAVLLLLFGDSHFEALIVLEICSKAISLFVAILACRTVLTWSGVAVIRSANELRENIRAGIKITIANTSNMLIIGVARAVVDRVWGIAVFGTVSLMLNLTTLVLVFFGAAGSALYPRIARMSDRQRSPLYQPVHTIAVLLGLSLLLVYSPVLLIMSTWLPAYAESLPLLVYIFPIVVFEARMGILLNPYMKAVREERRLLSINVIVVAVTSVMVITSAMLLGDLRMVLLSLVVGLGVRVHAVERVLADRLQTSGGTTSILELLLVTVFVVAHAAIGGWIASLIYAFALGVAALLSRRKAVTAVRDLREVFRS